MKVILYASLSANGQVLFAENADHQVPPEIMSDFMQQAMKAGNIIMGRKTFDLMMKNPAAKQAFHGIEAVIISDHLKDAEGVTVVSSPSEALQYLDSKAISTAIVAGGALTYQSFLTEGLMDELFLNVTPVITSKGGSLVPYSSPDFRLELIDMKKMTGTTVQLHYAAPR